jgi:hypothetical protein
VIRIKPHHFVDIVTAVGSGKRSFEPHPYGHALHLVAQKILEDPGICLEIEMGADDICRPCVHNVEGICDDFIDISYRPEAPASKSAWNSLIDQRWCVLLGLRQSDRLSARDFCSHLRRMDQTVMAEVYREIPTKRVAQRLEDLRAGILAFLGES